MSRVLDKHQPSRASKGARDNLAKLVVTLFSTLFASAVGYNCASAWRISLTLCDSSSQRSTAVSTGGWSETELVEFLDKLPWGFVDLVAFTF